jgi:hypothetical protein
MPDALTPGQVAYAAWWMTFSDSQSAPSYQEQTPRTQRAWEAAAQAVLAQALADRVWARQAPSSRWQERPQEEER